MEMRRENNDNKKREFNKRNHRGVEIYGINPEQLPDKVEE